MVGPYNTIPRNKENVMRRNIQGYFFTLFQVYIVADRHFESLIYLGRQCDMIYVAKADNLILLKFISLHVPKSGLLSI